MKIRPWLTWVGFMFAWVGFILLLPFFTYSSTKIQSNASLTPSLILLPPLRMEGLQADITESANSGQKQIRWRRSRGGEECDGRRVYMYELPSAMNSWLLEQCDGKLADWLHICPHMQNGGLGVKIAVGEYQKEEDWYRTDPYMLELIFHSRMRTYPCLTLDADLADAFFIPYYSGIDALQYLYGNLRHKNEQHGVELVDWLQNMHPNWRRRGGHDHFLVGSRVAWDFTRYPGTTDESWGTSLRHLTELANITMLFVESRPWPWAREFEQSIPYATAFHPSSLASLKKLTESLALPPSRPHLFSFSGAPRTGKRAHHVRRVVLEQCLSASPHTCALVDCSLIKCAHDPLPIFRIQRQSDFCLQPPGDTASRRSTFDGIIAGCIPVFFSNESAYNQYTWHLPADADSYSVFISEADLLGGLQVESYLRQHYPPQRIQRMRRNVIELLPRVLYAALPLTDVKDAFDLSVDGFLRKIKVHHRT